MHLAAGVAMGAMWASNMRHAKECGVAAKIGVDDIKRVQRTYLLAYTRGNSRWGPSGMSMYMSVYPKTSVAAQAK